MLIAETLQADMKTIQSLRQAVELLHAYANDELELSGHSHEVATALILTIQGSAELLETITQLDQALVERAKELFQINKS